MKECYRGYVVVVVMEVRGKSSGASGVLRVGIGQSIEV